MSTTEPAPDIRRLFVAIRPPATAIEALVDLTRSMGDEAGSALRWSPPEGYHVTLRYLGEAPVRPVVGALERVLPSEGITIELGPGLIELGTAIALPATGADALADRVTRAIGDLGRPQPDRPFLGHLTIARWKPGQRRDGVLETPFESRFTATSVELMASDRQPGSERSSYETIAAWPMLAS